jgi:hypothetical protein
LRPMTSSTSAASASGAAQPLASAATGVSTSPWACGGPSRRYRPPPPPPLEEQASSWSQTRRTTLVATERRSRRAHRRSSRSRLSLTLWQGPVRLGVPGASGEGGGPRAGGDGGGGRPRREEGLRVERWSAGLTASPTAWIEGRGGRMRRVGREKR